MSDKPLLEKAHTDCVVFCRVTLNHFATDQIGQDSFRDRRGSAINLPAMTGTILAMDGNGFQYSEGVIITDSVWVMYPQS